MLPWRLQSHQNGLMSKGLSLQKTGSIPYNTSRSAMRERYIGLSITRTWLASPNTRRSMKSLQYHHNFLYMHAPSLHSTCSMIELVSETKCQVCCAVPMSILQNFCVPFSCITIPNRAFNPQMLSGCLPNAHALRSNPQEMECSH